MKSPDEMPPEESNPPRTAPEGQLVRQDSEGGHIGHDLIVGADNRITKLKHSTFVASRDVLDSVDLDSLADTLRQEGRCCSSLPDEAEIVQISLGHPDQFNEFLFESDVIHLEVSPTDLCAVVEILLRRPPDLADIQKPLDLVASQYSCRLQPLTLVDEEGASLEERIRRAEEIPWKPSERRDYIEHERSRTQILVARVEATGPNTGRPLIEAAHDIRSLVLAMNEHGELDVTTASALLRSGKPNLLLGMFENEWLEVKSKPYSLSAPEPRAALAAKIELARDVSSFANGGRQAIIVIGIETVRRDRSDQLSRVTPSRLVSLSAQQYRDVIDNHVYPTIEGLLVEVIDLDSERGIMIIMIPRQPAEYIPFVVQGAIVGERVEGAFVSIVQRRGEATLPVTASQLHATLSAGRAFLRGSGTTQ